MKIWTKKSVIIISFSISLAIVGLVLSNVFFIVISVFLSSVLLLAFATVGENVRVTRTILNPKIFEDDIMSVRLEVVNRGMSFGLVEIYDKLPSAMKIVGGSNKATLKMRKGDRAFIHYSVECPLRGFYNIGPVTIRTWDMFTLFSEQKEWAEVTSITVYPRIDETRKFDVDTRYKKINPGSVMIRALGMGTDFHSIREYNTTDPFNRINWKATARKKRLMVNQYELEDVYDLMIFIDSRYVTKIGTPVRNSLEYSIKAAASIASAAIKKTNRVGLVTYGKEITIIPPGSSNTQMETFLATLTATYAGGKKTFKEALERATPFLTPKSPIIVMTPLQRDETIEDAVQLLLSKKYYVTVLSPSIVDFERLITGIYSPKYLLVKLERQNRLAKLRGMGINVVDWSPDRPLGDIIAEVAH